LQRYLTEFAFRHSTQKLSDTERIGEVDGSDSQLSIELQPNDTGLNKSISSGNVARNTSGADHHAKCFFVTPLLGIIEVEVKIN
jgi:hypothetical protein